MTYRLVMDTITTTGTETETSRAGIRFRLPYVVVAAVHNWCDRKVGYGWQERFRLVRE